MNERRNVHGAQTALWEILGHPSSLLVANTTLSNGPSKGFSFLAYPARMFRDANGQ